MHLIKWAKVHGNVAYNRNLYVSKDLMLFMQDEFANFLTFPFCQAFLPNMLEKMDLK